MDRDFHEKPNLTAREAEHALSLVRPRPAVLYEVVRKEGEIEMVRPFFALWWSGIAAGIAIGLSPLSKAFLRATFDGSPVGPLVEPIGYAAGFVIVILARQQLFTENTITTVLPLMTEMSLQKLAQTARVWFTVLCANLAGALLFASFIFYGQFIPPDVAFALTEISDHAVNRSVSNLFLGGVLAGWLIATLVWILPETESSKLLTILFVMYLVGLTEASHIIAGGVEAWFLILNGEASLFQTFLGFVLPTLSGNIVGGTALFALISYAQVRQEIDGNE